MAFVSPSLESVGGRGQYDGWGTESVALLLVIFHLVFERISGTFPWSGQLRHTSSHVL